MHFKDIEEVYRELASKKEGLTSEEASKRLRKYGPNAIKEEKNFSAIKIFLSQFKSALVIVLIAATLISLAIGHFVDASVIGAIVILNSGFGFVQEYKAEKAMEALKKMAAPHAMVLRDGKEKSIRSADVVPGDIILLDAGTIIPADARIIENTNLEVDEAVLTGESVPVRKEEGNLPKDTRLAERLNMVYSGTAISQGHGIAIVVATGMLTEFGKIAKLVRDTKEVRTPLQNKLATTAKYIGVGVVIIAAVVFGVGIFRGIAPLEMFLNAIALAVAAVPEGLPAVVTITLAIGVKTMASKKAIVRKLPVAETLGSATVICSDKTGTLTKNEMTVTRIFVDGKVIEVTGAGYDIKGKFLFRGKAIKDKILDKLLEIASLCNLAKLDGQKVLGDPTEGALLVAARKAKIDVQSRYKKIGEISFTSTRKLMTTIHRSRKLTFAAVKGAPSTVLDKCTQIFIGGRVRKITKKDREAILQAKENMTTSALRVLAFAYRPVKSVEKIEATRIEKNLIFVGLMGMIDPPRPEVHKAISLCKQAGIKVVMVTGDDRDTAVSIAKNIGLYSGGKVVLGETLDKISAKELAREIDDIEVFARVSPTHKLHIIDALRKKGHIIAMTGDGVNDAPALKDADIGIAMGIKGTDVSKEASDIVLEDDNFATLVTAVEEGRRVYDNIKKFVRYLLSCNVGEVLIIFLAALIGLPLPLIAVQILMVNLLTDGLPALALGVDPAAEGVMSRKPRSPKERIIGWPMVRTIMLVGSIMCIGVLALFKWALVSGLAIESARSVAFTGVVAFQLFNVFNSRSADKSAFRSGMPSPWTFAAVGSSIALQLAVVYLPALQGLFGTAAISVAWLGGILLVAASVLAIVEAYKFVVRRVSA